MPLDIPNIQPTDWGLSRIMMEASYYSARAQEYKSLVEQHQQVMAEKQAIQDATTAATKPGAPQSMMSPEGDMSLSLGRGPSTTNPLDVISELEKRNPELAVKVKTQYFKGLEDEQKFNDTQQSRSMNGLMTGMLMTNSGAIQQGMTLLKKYMPDLAAVRQIDQQNFQFKHQDGSTETVNVPKYIDSLQTAQDLFKAKNELNLKVLEHQKDLKAEAIKAGEVVRPDGTKMKLSDATALYKAAADRVQAILLDPTKSTMLESTNPEKYKALQKEAENLKDPISWINKNLGVDLTPGAKSRAIPGEKVKGGKPGSMVAQTPGGTGPEVVDLPKSRDELQDGQKYNTSKGPAIWNEKEGHFVAQ